MGKGVESFLGKTFERVAARGAGQTLRKAAFSGLRTELQAMSAASIESGAGALGSQAMMATPQGVAIMLGGSAVTYALIKLYCTKEAQCQWRLRSG